MDCALDMGTAALSKRWRGEVGEFKSMKRILFDLAAAGALSLTACDDVQERDVDERPMAVEAEPVAPAAEDSAAPVVAPDVRDPAPTTPPPETLPPEPKTSEESVQPESETLFY